MCVLFPSVFIGGGGGGGVRLSTWLYWFLIFAFFLSLHHTLFSNLRPLVALAAVRSYVEDLLLLIFCQLLLPLWDSVILLCFVVCYVVCILAFAITSMEKKELVALLCMSSWCLVWLLGGSSLRCHRFDCILWLWYFLIILTILT